MLAEIYYSSFRVFVCDFHPEISSFFDKSFPFFPPFFVKTLIRLSYPTEVKPYGEHIELKLQPRNYVHVANNWLLTKKEIVSAVHLAIVGLWAFTTPCSSLFACEMEF